MQYLAGQVEASCSTSLVQVRAQPPSAPAHHAHFKGSHLDVVVSLSRLQNGCLDQSEPLSASLGDRHTIISPSPNLPEKKPSSVTRLGRPGRWRRSVLHCCSLHYKNSVLSHNTTRLIFNRGKQDYQINRMKLKDERNKDVESRNTSFRK